MRFTDKFSSKTSDLRRPATFSFICKIKKQTPADHARVMSEDMIVMN